MSLADLLKQRRTLKAEADKIIKDAGDGLPNEDGQRRLDEIRTAADALDRRIENQELADRLDRNAPGLVIAGDDRWETHKREFRLTRLMAATFDPTIDAQREREICTEQARRAGKKPRGLLVPFDCITPRRRVEKRVLTIAGDGQNLVSNVVMGEEFIDALRPAAVATALGARAITVENTDIALPRRDARAPAATWFVENNTINSGDQSFDQVSGTPHHLGLITEFGRKTLIQAEPAIEDLTRQHFIAELGAGLDLGVMKGTGLTGQPTGITQTEYIGAKDSASAAPSWSDILEVEAMVEGADVSPNALGWALNAYTKAKFRSTLKVTADAGAGFLMDSRTMLDDAPVGVTSQLAGDTANSPGTDGEAIFGAWDQVIVAMWGGVEILVNPYESTAYSKGNVSVRGIVDADVLVRHPQAFVYWQNIGL